MQITSKSKKSAVLFFVVLLIFQAISFTYGNIGQISTYYFNCHELLSRNNIPIHITLIKKNDIIRSFFNIIEEQINNNILENIYIVYMSKNNSLYNAKLDDSYEDINLMNPHYFHGSKYKEQSLFFILG